MASDGVVAGDGDAAAGARDDRLVWAEVKFGLWVMDGDVRGGVGGGGEEVAAGVAGHADGAAGVGEDEVAGGGGTA